MTNIRKCADSIAETEIDDEMVVMSLDTGEFFSLKGTGRQIWALLDELGDQKQLAERLAADYETEESVLAADLELFLAQLLAAGLVARN